MLLHHCPRIPIEICNCAVNTLTLHTPYITLALPQLTPDLVAGARVWLQCRMGLCSATQAGARGNIKRCVDPELVCAAPEAERGSHAESSLQQVTVRGPLHVAPVSRRDRARDPHVSVAQLDPTKPNQDPAFTATTSHTLVEVPVEHCDLVPRKQCGQITRLVPQLRPATECAMVPTEVSSNIFLTHVFTNIFTMQ